MRIPPWLFIVGIILVVGLTAVGALLAFSVARQVAVDLGAQGVQFTAFQVGDSVPTPTPVSIVSVATPQSVPTSAAPDVQTAAPTPTLDPAAEYAWNDPRRFTLLLMGIDQRSGVEDEGPFRTDTMIVISVDPVRKTAGVLNIPRDLWVNIPGFTQGRINTANSLGDSSNYPGGGPALAAETVRQVLGIPIDHYVLVNFDVFTAVVNIVAPNGVEVCPPAIIDDPDYPDAGFGTIPVRFEAGCQTLQAERLLQYARTRASEGADFDRARRQQEVLDALREEVLSVGGITNFIGQAPALWEQLSGSFRTNMSLNEILQLGSLMSEIPRENIHFGVIDNLYVNLATTTTGDQVLLLKTNATRLLLQQIFNPEEDLSLSDLRARAETENATIMVFNNTDQAGLAGQTRDWLTGRGIDVLDVGNVAAASNANTVINVYTGKVWTARYLAALMGLPAERVQPGADGLTDKDIAVLVGPDIATVLSSP
jgi:LCP family protein required for cell wall assembly